MAKKVKTPEEIDKRYRAFKRLCRMKNSYCDIPPVEIYGLDIKKKGELTKRDIINCLLL